MAQSAQRRMTDAQINETVTAQLIQAGYSRPQATQLLTMANTMARGRNVGAPPSWMNSGDLDRVSQAILNVRNNESDAASALGRIRIVGPNMTEAQMRDAILGQLIARGYSDDQARTIVDFAARGARGEVVNIPPTLAWLDMSDLTKARTAINQGINHPDRARGLVSGLLIAGPQRVITMRTVPAPVREYAHEYTVAVDGRRYRVESSQDLRWSGIATAPGQTQGGRLMALLQSRSALRITELDASGSPRRDSSGNPVLVSRQQLADILRPANTAIANEFSDAHRAGRDINYDIIARVSFDYVDPAVRRARPSGA